MTVLTRRLAVTMLIAQFVVPVPARAGVLGTSLFRGSNGKSAGTVPILWRRPVGPIWYFPRPTRPEWFTNRPSIDTRRGLGEHFFWRRPGSGRKAVLAKDIKLRENLLRG